MRTALCELLGIEHPIIQAGMGSYTSAELAAAVSNAGGLGTISAFLRPVQDLRDQLSVLRDLTDRPFAVNHVAPVLDEESFVTGLVAQPKLVSLALGDPGDLVKRAHHAGTPKPRPLKSERYMNSCPRPAKRPEASRRCCRRRRSCAASSPRRKPHCRGHRRSLDGNPNAGNTQRPRRCPRPLPQRAGWDHAVV